MVGSDDWEDKVADDEALQNRRNVAVDMIVLESGLSTPPM
jgi:hypothetical protein